MQPAWAETLFAQRIHGLLEAHNLLRGQAVVDQVGVGEMAEHAIDLDIAFFLRKAGQLDDLVNLDAQPAHAGIYL